MKTLLSWITKTCFLTFALLLFQAPLAAAPILTLELDSALVDVGPGEASTISGTITNRSNTDLFGMDFILNFANYDASVLEPFQLLGQSDITIPSFSFAADLDLFSIILLPEARPGTYFLDVLLQDVYGNFADQVSLRVIVDGASTPIPEPGSLPLILSCIALLILVRNFSRPGPQAPLQPSSKSAFGGV